MIKHIIIAISLVTGASVLADVPNEYPSINKDIYSYPADNSDIEEQLIENLRRLDKMQRLYEEELELHRKLLNGTLRLA